MIPLMIWTCPYWHTNGLSFIAINQLRLKFLYIKRRKRAVKFNNFNIAHSSYTTRIMISTFDRCATHSSAKKVAAKITLTKTHVNAAWDLLVICFLWKESSTIVFSLLTIRLCIFLVVEVQQNRRSIQLERINLPFWISKKKDRWVSFTWTSSAQFLGSELG